MRAVCSVFEIHLSEGVDKTMRKLLIYRRLNHLMNAWNKIISSCAQVRNAVGIIMLLLLLLCYMTGMFIMQQNADGF